MPIDLNNLNQYGLFQLFWNTHDDPDLSGGGLNELTPRGAEKLAEFALGHELDGSRSADARRLIGQDEKELVRALLEHPHYSAFFELDGRVKLMELFGLQAEDIHSPDRVRPQDMGELQLPGRVSQVDVNRLANVHIKQLPELFAREYGANRAFFEGGNATPEVKGARVLALLRDYSDALWARGEHPDTEKVGHALLDAFEKCRYANVVGSTNYNGAPWSAAQSLVLGLDPNEFKTDFPNAGSDVKTTYLAMNDGMAVPMRSVDAYLAAKGKATGAETYELRAPLGFMIGEPNGHYKRGSLDEKKPFSSSGLNWGLVLFPNDPLMRKTEPKPGFEFPIDCLDGLGNFLRCDPKHGERMEVIGKDGAKLNVEKVIENGPQGEPQYWSAKFTDAQGKEVKPEDALGVFMDARGRVKGDKRAANSVNMWWWGFCDRNTAQKLYKAKYGIPELDVATVKVKAGNQTIEVPRDVAQKLIDTDVPDIVTGNTMCGFRFNDESQNISLKDGSTIQGRVAGDVLENAAGLSRLSGDQVAVHNDDKRPLLGTIDLDVNGSIETLSTKNIKSLERDPATGQVTVHLENGWRDKMTGTLKSEVSWAGAVERDGKQVIEQGETFPVRGDLKVNLADGTSRTVPIAKVSQIVGEMTNDLRPSQYLTWVSQNDGMYATDSSKREVVSNGMRWTNRIDQDVRHGDDRPDWAPAGELLGIEGQLERVPGDKIVWFQGKYGNNGGEANYSGFSGWVQVGKHGRVLNEGFADGAPDFGWSANGKLDWNAQSSFNPFMPAELRIALLVNGVGALKEDGAETDKIAERLNLPANWRTYRS